MDSEAKIFFNQFVTDWWYSLEEKLRDSASQERNVVLIALSRKMPRFLRWFKKNIAGFTTNPDSMHLLNDVELSTELSIPFLFVERPWNNIDFIILDDIIIHGTSLKSVADELFFLTGNKPQMSCIVRLDRAVCPDNIPLADFEKIPVICETEADSFSDSLSTIVSENQLPLDMEFPVFKIKKSGFTGEAISDIIKNFLTDSDQHGFVSSVYNTGVGKFAVDFMHKANVGLNVDFAKVRFFIKEASVVFEVINPLIFSDDEITSLSSHLFPHNFYQAIWERTTRAIRVILDEGKVKESVIPASIRDHFIRSLVVWVNYLYSISCVSKNIDHIIPRDIQNNIAFSSSDLSLILGHPLTEVVVPLLRTLILTKDYCVSLKDTVSDLPDWFAPTSFANDIRIVKTSAALEKSNVEDVFGEIFKFQHYGNPGFQNPYRTFERLFFGETFESLLKSLHPFFEAKANMMTLRAWVDDNIDNGYIIPKYEKADSRSGDSYWRRYFHAGIRKMS